MVLEHNPNSLMYYSDSISHLVISRETFDSISPGLGQLGSVWPPMTHLLLLPFVTNDFLFHSGLAGTIISTLSTAVTAVILFRIARLQFDSTLAGIIAASLILLNPSVIYMGLVPMTELPFLMFFIISVYYIQQWYYAYARDDTDTWKQYRSIIKAAFAISAATLTAYEGWLLPFVVMFILLAIALNKRTSRYRIKAIITAAVPYSFTGIMMWIVWNLLVQKDPLYFVTGPYSGKMETAMMPSASYLYLNPAGSLSIIYDIAKAMYGVPVLILSLSGVLLFLYMCRTRKMLPFSFILLVMLLIPTLSDLTSIILGYQGILPNRNGGWSNGRLLVFMAPFFAFTSAFVVAFITKRTRIKALTISSACFVIALWAFTLVPQISNIGKVVALNDTDSMIPFARSDQIALDTGRDLKKLYTESGNILLFAGTQHSQEIMFGSGLPLKNFIYSGSGIYWNASQANPWLYAKYIVLDRSPSQEDRADPTFREWGQWQYKIMDLINTRHPITHNNVLRQSYQIIYQNDRYDILKRVILSQNK